jgi:hypothetical protein
VARGEAEKHAFDGTPLCLCVCAAPLR